MKNAFTYVFFVSLFSGLALMAADLETVTLKGTRDKVSPGLITALARVVDIKSDQNRTRIARSLGIKLEENISRLLVQPEKIHEIVEFVKKKINVDLERLMENGFSEVTVDFSPGLITTLARLPSKQVSEYINKIPGASLFIVDIEPTTVIDKNIFVASYPTLRVFGNIIDFKNLSEDQLLSIAFEMPPIVIVSDGQTYKSSVNPQDILTGSELMNAIHYSLMNEGDSFIKLSMEKLENLCDQMGKKLVLLYN